MSETEAKNTGLGGLVDTIQTGGMNDQLPPPPAEGASNGQGEAAKTWQRLAPGEVPKIGEKVKCRDGQGTTSRVDGPNTLTKLDSGYFHWGGIDQLLVLR